MEELEDEIYEKIEALSAAGNQFAERDAYDEAIGKFEKALELVPEPKIDWEASTWLYASIGDMLFSKEDYRASLDQFFNAQNCPGGIGNPFIQLRIGECLFETEVYEESADYLMRAYMLEGEKLFATENSKYLQHLKNHAKI